MRSLYDRYGGMVYSVAQRVLNDSGAAEEVLQDIFMQLWRSAESFDPARGTLSGWLLVMARNRAIDRLRRRPVGVNVDAETANVPLGVNLESAVAQREMMARVAAAVAALPEAQQKTLELAYYNGMTQTEIAAATGEPLGTVKTRLRSALQTLRQALNP